MKSPDNVLIGVALLLLSGVILYNVFTTSDEEVVTSNESTTSAVISTTSSMVLGTSEVVTSDGKININTASSSQLQTLSGIGPTKAQAIIDYRVEHGNFSSVEELINVSGIGEKTLEKIIDNITV